MKPQVPLNMLNRQDVFDRASMAFLRLPAARVGQSVIELAATFRSAYTHRRDQRAATMKGFADCFAYAAWVWLPDSMKSQVSVLASHFRLFCREAGMDMTSTVDEGKAPHEPVSEEPSESQDAAPGNRARFYAATTREKQGEPAAKAVPAAPAKKNKSKFASTA